METVPPGDYKWLVGFTTANMVLSALTAVVRRRFGDDTADTCESCGRGVGFGAFAVWLAVFWGFTYAAGYVGLGVVAFAVIRYRRRRVNTVKPESVDVPTGICS